MTGKIESSARDVLMMILDTISMALWGLLLEWITTGKMDGQRLGTSLELSLMGYINGAEAP